MQQRKLAKQSSTGEVKPKSTEPEKRKSKFPNPLAIFRIIGQKESGLVLVYNGLFFTGMMVRKYRGRCQNALVANQRFLMQVTVTVLPALFDEAYKYNELQIGLTYISNGMGALIASLTMGHVVDYNFRRHAKNLGVTITKGKQQDVSNFPIERVRLEIVLPAHVIGILGLLMFGWTVKFKTHIAGPEIALFIIGFGFSTAFNMTNGLLIDLNRDQPATATAAVNFCRCLMSAGGCAAILPMCHAMNPGWAFSLLALIYAGTIVMVFWIMRDGMRWRQELEEKRRLESQGQ